MCEQTRLPMSSNPEPKAKHLSRLLVPLLLSLTMCGSHAHSLEIMTRSDWGAESAIVKRDPPIDPVSGGDERVAVENELKPLAKPVYLTVHHTGRAAMKQPLATNIKNFQN